MRADFETCQWREWWAWLDLNQRLSRYEQGVLTFELHAPTLARWESNPPLRIWRPPCYRNTSHQKGYQRETIDELQARPPLAMSQGFPATPIVKSHLTEASFGFAPCYTQTYLGG